METIADFEIQYSQFLDPAGKPSADIPDLARDADKLVDMYRHMVETRVFDTKAINLQRTGKLGTYASCLGHEATHVGLAAAMQEDDVLAPSYREYGAMLYRGVSRAEFLMYWGGDERGSDFAGPRNDFPFCVPIATQCLHSAGAAMAFQMRGEARCAVSVNGDGGTSEGAFYEAMNIAGARKLPVVFMVVNNKWAISVPIELQTATKTLAQKAVAAGIPGIQVDGNDVIAVRHWVERALARARNGDGATLVEAVTYRLSDHTTADDASRYRKKGEVETAWKLEPLIRIRQYLTDIGVWDEKKEQALLAEAATKVDNAVQSYLNTPKQPIEAMFDYMYKELPEFLEEQRDHAIQYGDNDGGHHG
ncbi:MAG: pyruvate dehydrogenase (acetyl-transferring) E1 component subunit alpha [Gammaproteobacteria bacterium]|nr:pyruvate dehydrogenase (acetyl-transferring) E1 component subunit alpha [Gammaproteobacteria bacterium]